MYQAILDINLQKSNGVSKNHVMASNLIANLYDVEKQIVSAINNCKRSYKNLPLCHVTIIIFDITNKIITHYKDINITEYTYNDSVMATAKIPVTNSETAKKDYSNLFAMYEYALLDMQKNN